MSPRGGRATVATRFGSEIARALSEGAEPQDLTLHLTLGDVAQLKRDPAVPIPDISFVGGGMTFLGVTVIKGGVDASVLRGPEADASATG
jgi:hypothetical protein